MIEVGIVVVIGIRVWDENNFFLNVKKMYVIMWNDFMEVDDLLSGELEG